MTKKEKQQKMRSLPRRIVRALLALLLIALLAFAGLVAFLSATEYRPEDRESAQVEGAAQKTLQQGGSLRIATWNIGCGVLGDNADFFMDGGTSVMTADSERVKQNMAGMLEALSALDADILFLQEVDRDSARSHGFDEYGMLQSIFIEMQSSFANNLKVAFIPYPLPPIGRVDSGIATFSAYSVADAERVQLPIPFSWPVRMANLKRCVLISRLRVEGTDRELVLMNLHLEAYDSGEGKIAQTNMLAQLLREEAEKGNWVIAGGDFNQVFSSVDASAYPAQEGKWAAGEIDVSQFEGDWQFLMDASVPSCRSLDQPLAGADLSNFQYYVIDGFILSGDLQVELLAAQDLGFVCSDHNPVLLQVSLP